MGLPLLAHAGGAAPLRPFVGETAEEFEARRLGKPRPERNGERTTLKADRRGHFVTTARIDGEDVKAVVDTGASAVMLSYEDAERIGYRLDTRDFKTPVKTANGETTVAVLRLKEVQVGDVIVRDVQAAVSQPRALHISLLGMTFLRRLKRFETRGDYMVLEQ